MGLILGDAPIPINDALVDDRKMVTSTWVDWMTTLTTVVSQGPNRLNSTTATAQAASISATDASGGGIGAGSYRVSYYAQITQAATINSSLTVTLTWTYNGVLQTFSGTAITGNTTTTNQSGSLTILAAGSPVNYSTTYASAGATPMQYALGVTFEQIA